MKTFKEHLNDKEEVTASKFNLQEGALFGLAVERKLKAALSAIQSTDDTNKKLDILMKSLHFSIGNIALNLTSSKSTKKRYR